MAQTRKKRVLEEVRKQRQRRTIVTITLVVVLIAIIVVGVYFLTRSTGGMNWPFNCLGTEGNAFHIHPWLRIWINGLNVTVPAGIGIQGATVVNGFASGGSCYEPIHTHDTSGIIHIESPDTTTQYTLTDLFEIWNLTYHTTNINGIDQAIVFNGTDILGYKLDRTHTLSLLIDEGKSSYQNSTQFCRLVLIEYDYCNAAIGNVPPCSPTATGDPYPQSYPYGTGHTLVIYYKSV